MSKLTSEYEGEIAEHGSTSLEQAGRDGTTTGER